MLQQSLIDGKLSRAEKSVLREILTSNADTSHQRDLLRNRAFEIARLSVPGPDAKKAIVSGRNDLQFGPQVLGEMWERRYHPVGKFE